MSKLNTPQVMGILNVTPDSFYDGGKYQLHDSILQQVDRMIHDGASIIDVGGYSTRPNAQDVSIDEELSRTLPIIELIRKNFKTVQLSIDTFRSVVAQKCFDAGATIINDISGGSIDPDMFKTVAKLKATYVLMHIQGRPQNMQNNPTYHHVVQEVKTYFRDKIAELHALGINDVIIDPGFGFGKTTKHNYELLNSLDQFHDFKLPILTGFSRKSMINNILNTSPKEALNGTTVLNTIALLKGSKILRVHDVKEAQESIKLVAQLNLGK